MSEGREGVEEPVCSPARNRDLGCGDIWHNRDFACVQAAGLPLSDFQVGQNFSGQRDMVVSRQRDVEINMVGLGNRPPARWLRLGRWVITSVTK